MHEIHSVILNLNQNFSNNKGSDFSQIVNKQLELKPNTLCALYTGNLVRKPIVLDEPTRLNLVIGSGFLTAQQKAMTTVATNVVGDLNTNDTYPGYMRVDIPKGEYSKLEFCRTFCDKFNAEILENFKRVATTVVPVSGKPAMRQCFPYRMYYEMRGEQFYLGLRYQLPENTEETGQANDIDRYMVSFEDLDDGLLNTSNVTAVDPTNAYQQVYKPNAGATAGKYTDFLLGNAPLRGMAQGSIMTDRPNDVAFATIGLRGNAPSKTCKFAFNLHNTYFSSLWGTGGVNTPEECQVEGITGETHPQAQISCILEAVGDGSAYTGITAKVLVNQELKNLGIQGDGTSRPYTDATDRDAFALANFRILKEVDLKTDFDVDLLKYTEFTWEVYMRLKGASGDVSLTSISEEARDYGFRLICNTPYGTDTPKAVIFDSKEIGLMLHKDVVETGYLFQQLKEPNDATKEVTGGLCPQFYWSNCENDELVLFNPVANMVAEQYLDSGDGDVNFLYYGGINSYSFFVPDSKAYKPNVNISSLQNILGVADINRSVNTVTGFLLKNPTGFNPNLFPRFPEQAGITQLGSDRMRYNIEVNLPVRAYNTTESETNDLGQIRNIVHNSNPVVEDVTNLSSGLVNRNLEPHDIKYLSLNNKEALKLNTLDITIRRAKTNKIADEIIDASVELLFKSGEC